MKDTLTNEERIAREYAAAGDEIPEYESGMPITWHERVAMWHATHGDYRKLALLVRGGWPLSKRARNLIADYLENPKQTVGAPRSWPQVQRDGQIANEYVALRASGWNSYDAREELSDKYRISADRVKQIVTAEKRRFREMLKRG